MFKWIGKKLEATQADEASRFLDSLRGIDTGGLDIISAQTMYWASFYAAKGLDFYSMESWIYKDLFFPVQLVNAIKQLQRTGSPTSTLGIQVWLHSARAFISPELRIYGRDIWTELVKATDEAAVIAVELYNGSGMQIGETDSTRVPAGLEKLVR